METHICLGGKAWIGIGILQGDTMTGLFWRDQQSLFMENFSRGSLSFLHLTLSGSSFVTEYILGLPVQTHSTTFETAASHPGRARSCCWNCS